MDHKILAELEKLKQIILQTVPVEQIFLFGSYAYGTPNENSDIDLYVVMPDIELRPLEAMQKIGQAMYKNQKLPVDVLVSKKSNFEKRKLLPTLEKDVVEKGIVLFG